MRYIIIKTYSQHNILSSQQSNQNKKKTKTKIQVKKKFDQLQTDDQTNMEQTRKT